MEVFDLRNLLTTYINEICHYCQMQVFSTSDYQREYFQRMVGERMTVLQTLIERYMVPREDVVFPGYVDLPVGEQIEQPIVQPIVGPIEQPIDQPIVEPIDQPMIPAPIEEEPRVFTLEELAMYDGVRQREIYVAVNDIVYDVSAKPGWVGGYHFLGIRAGQDLTDTFMNCHLGMLDVLAGLPIVGVLHRG